MKMSYLLFRITRQISEYLHQLMNLNSIYLNNLFYLKVMKLMKKLTMDKFQYKIKFAKKKIKITMERYFVNNSQK